jgi:vacuolar-type H+-ATPase subunit C/Vma6
MTPEQRALARLEALRINDAMPERQAAYAYGIMTDVVKEYIQAVYGLSIRHLTDYECIERLRHSDLERALVEKLCRMFDDAAAIKFVQNPVAARTVQHDLQQIRDVIHATRVVQQSSTAVK